MELIDNLCNQIAQHTICFFGDSLAMPSQSFLKKFPDEFRDRINEVLHGKVIERATLNYEFPGGAGH